MKFKKLKTLVDVNCNVKNETNPFNGIVISKLGDIILPLNGGIKVDVQRYDEDGNFLTRKWANYSDEEVNAIYEQVKHLVPENPSFTDLFETAMNEAHKIEAAQTFGINVNQLEFVNDEN